MDLVQRINNTAFLGREFLTWVWFKAEGNEGIFKLGERYVEVYFDDKLTLEALGDIKETNVIKSEAPTETEEARASLQSGKHVSEARLRVVAEQKQWAVTIKADSLAMGSLKIPGILSKEDDDKVYERLYLIEEAEDIIDELFASYLTLRLDADQWPLEVNAMRQWVANA